MTPLTDAERALAAHVNMFGSDGYPLRKLGGRWFWVDAFGVRGTPIAYRTKREATAAFEVWLELYRLRYAEEAHQRALQEGRR